MPQESPIQLLLRVGPAAGEKLSRGETRAAGTRFDLSAVTDLSAEVEESLAIESRPVWRLAVPADSTAGAHPWELAHQALREGLGVGASPEDIFIEPDLVQEWICDTNRSPRAEGLAMLGKGASRTRGKFDDQEAVFPRQEGRFAWFLRKEFSQLGEARGAVDESRVRIAHLDTGYDATHQTLPARLRKDLARNFTVNPPDNNATDPPGALFENQGHGAATLALLAGGRFRFAGSGYDFDDLLGGAPEAEIVPLRIAESVVLLRTSAFARAIEYLLTLGHDPRTRIDVLSMSMGGVASRAWADAVNRAFEAGICLVTAAGNYYKGLMPHWIVYPARFARVIAVCGVMADDSPYEHPHPGGMSGSWGPASKMATAISAYTPNMPWAEFDSKSIVDMNGEGTSSATPQVAAAAALWMARHREELERYPEPWMRVEAVRRALFSRARVPIEGRPRSSAAADAEDKGKEKRKERRAPILERLGCGILQASRSLDVPPADASELRQTPRDSAALSLFRVLTGFGVEDSSRREEMFALEATQLLHRPYGAGAGDLLEKILPDPDLPQRFIPDKSKREFLAALIEHPAASPPLRNYLKAAYERRFGAPPPSPAEAKAVPKIPPPPAPQPAPAEAQPSTPALPYYTGAPPFRRLRGYAFDPSLSTRLETAVVNEVNYDVKWEPLRPGPVGEYLEVVDYDPASRCFYEPVDLENQAVAAQNGLSPSEGLPQFHQQMVYAVAMTTIQNFERALGRKIFWAPGPPPPDKHEKDDSNYVQRLRIYPHAMREANAYYSPAKKALLFGYFPASSDAPDEHLPGGTVFTCLSHDIIAHEITHALLDGMHRKFRQPSNPDVLAFHEAFADIVAMFQRFSFPEVLRHELGRTRGDLRAENLLAGMAWQFGRSTGMRGALRDAIGRVDPETGKWQPHVASPAEFERARRPHSRGAIFAAAVFDAFLAIYAARTADLLRIASGGSGVLPAGAISRDLVNRLAGEAAASARDVLTMCVRALDYCPPVDLTFGEYLRALITADYDLVRDDDLRYRVAFIEAFRRRGIYPRDVRTLSQDSLLWRRPDQETAQPSGDFENGLQLLKDFGKENLFASTPSRFSGEREHLFRVARAMRARLHGWLSDHFKTGAAGEADARWLGLDPQRTFEVHSVRFAQRISPGGVPLQQIIIGILQQSEHPVAPAYNGAPRSVIFEGGCTLIADLRRLKILYCIRKNLNSAGRLERQIDFWQGLRGESLQGTYLASRDLAGAREPFALLHREMEGE